MYSATCKSFLTLGAVLTWSFVKLVLKVHHGGELVDEVDAVAEVVGRSVLAVNCLVDEWGLLKSPNLVSGIKICIA